MERLTDILVSQLVKDAVSLASMFGFLNGAGWMLAGFLTR
jgi:hypothetical protein